LQWSRPKKEKRSKSLNKERSNGIYGGGNWICETHSTNPTGKESILNLLLRDIHLSDAVFVGLCGIKVGHRKVAIFSC